MKRTTQWLTALVLLAMVAGARPMAGNGVKDGVMAPTAAQEVLQVVIQTLDEMVKETGMHWTREVQIPGMGWDQQGQVRWGAPVAYGEPVMKASQLYQYDYRLSGDLDPDQAAEVQHRFSMELEEIRTWKVHTSRTETTDLNVNVNVKYPIGGVGRLEVDTELEEVVSTTQEEWASEQTRFDWTQEETVTVKPNTTAYGRLFVYQQPFRVQWSVDAAATGVYLVTFHLTPAMVRLIEDRVQRADRTFHCTYRSDFPLQMCQGRIEALVDADQRSFLVEGELLVEYGTENRSCTEVVPLNAASEQCR